MIRLTDEEAIQQAQEVSGWRGPFKIKKDTSEFFDIQASDIVHLEDSYFLIRGEAQEPRFGLEGEPKWWVKRAQHLPSGRRVLLKLVFLESFNTKIGPLSFRCYRAPEKEARILRLVAGVPGFMQGQTLRDQVGNPIRVLEIVTGPTLDQLVGRLGNKPHREYFETDFPDLIVSYAQSVEDMVFLHGHKELHGDIRRDHLIQERYTNRLTWIDFDYTCDYSRVNRFAYDLFGLGNILIYLTGGGVWRLADIAREGYNDVIDSLTRDDLNIVFSNQLANMKKLFPYVPEELNRICLSFSWGAKLFYETSGQILADLQAVIDKYWR